MGCGNTILVEYANNEPCELKSSDCIIYEDAIAYLSLSSGSTQTEVVQALLSSLIDARDRINSLEAFTPTTVDNLPTGVIGQVTSVTDALTPTYRTTVVGGGAEFTAVIFNGTNWICQ